MAVEVPIEIWRRSNDPPVIWDLLKRDGTPVNVNGFSFKVVASWSQDLRSGQPAGSISHSTDDMQLDLDVSTASLTWRPTLAENARIPRIGARYEMFGMKGDYTRLIFGGSILMKGFL